MLPLLPAVSQGRQAVSGNRSSSPPPSTGRTQRDGCYRCSAADKVELTIALYRPYDPGEQQGDRQDAEAQPVAHGASDDAGGVAALTIR